jgi:hypothetical protein
VARRASHELFDPEHPPWWLDPLVSWLVELDFRDSMHLRIWTIEHRREIARFAIQLMARDRASGKFLWPVTPLADAYMLPPIAGNPTPLDALPLEERRQVIAVGNLLFVAWYAARQPTRVEAGGPRGLDHPGDVVGVGRVRGVETAARGFHHHERDRNPVERSQFVRAKGVAGKTLGATIFFYGVPRAKATRTLTRLATGVDLTVEQVSALIPPDLRHLSQSADPLNALSTSPSSDRNADRRDA